MSRTIEIRDVKYRDTRRYTYTIFDADPAVSGPSAWPSHEDLEIEADSSEDAVSDVAAELDVEAAGLSPSDGYEVGQTIYALVWDADGQVIARLTHDLSAEDLGADKSGVRSWSTEATYVQTYPDASDCYGSDGACDVEVQVGEVAGVWYLRTRDDAGGSDECDDTSYSTEAEAIAAAEEFATAANEANDGEDAEDYLRRQKQERVGEEDSDGAWCVYWSTSLDDSGPRERYATRDQAEAAVDLANEQLHQRNRGHLLCGFEVRELVDDEWIRAERE